MLLLLAPLALASLVAHVPVAGPCDAAPRSAPAHHALLPVMPTTVAWGFYHAAATPVLRLVSGDTVDVETLLTNVPDRLEAAGVAPADVQQSLRDVVTTVKDKGPGGHILTGPICIEGAEPGDVLEVRILAVDLAIPYGYNGCRGFLPEECVGAKTHIIPLDRQQMIGHWGNGLDVPLHPFFGSMGIAPAPEVGRLSSNPPGRHAGNLDNKLLVAGTTLYIPVQAAGALFEVGDGHAAQGDGEVDQTAIETSLTGRFQFLLRKDLHLTWPRAETPTEWITMGTDRDLTIATRIATQEMITFLAERLALSRAEAYQFASVAADLHITELVDENVGVHMTIAKSILNGAKTR
jgi:acetamidase/formamidase